MTQNSNPPKIVTRREAIATGLQRYYTGKACAQGHIDFRTTKDRKCDSCNRMRSKNWREVNPDKVKKFNDQYYTSHGARLKASQREWNRRNAEYATAYAAKFRKDNPDVARNWRQANKELVCLYRARRRAALLQRTPAWSEHDAIRQFYLACPPGCHVDHIIPLRGKLVSGLHVLKNLQYLSSTDNMKKLNKFDPETFTP